MFDFWRTSYFFNWMEYRIDSATLLKNFQSLKEKSKNQKEGDKARSLRIVV